MLSFKIVLALIATTAGASPDPDPVFAALLKRQAPGTPSYNCHDNCGTAVTIVKAQADICKDEVFLANYANCLQCAGSDNFNIWRYYGASLSAAGQKCGLETEPKAGKQDDVPQAQHPASKSGSSSAATPTPTSAPSAPPATTSAGIPSSTGESYRESNAAVTTTSALASGVPATPTNGTGSFTSSTPSPEFPGGASSLCFGKWVQFVGLIALGAAFGLFY